MKRTDVTSLQQSQKFEIPINLEAVNYGNVWLRQAQPNQLGTGEGSGAALIETRGRAPDFLLKMVAPTSGPWGTGNEIGAVLSTGIESGPDFTPRPISTT